MLSSPLSPAEWVRAAAEQPGSVLLATARSDAENHASYLFTGPLETLAACTLDEIPAVFAGIERALRAGNFVAGSLAYEAGYHFEPAALRGVGRMPESEWPLAWFGVYTAPLIRDGFPLDAQAGGDGGDAPEATAEIDISPQEYAGAVDRIRGLIAAGDLYQANFTFPIRMLWNGGADRLFERMMANQPVPYGALLNLGSAQVVSASPELFFRRSGDRILVRPMKGTCPRGRDLAEDARDAEWLSADEKNRAENVMIVDLLRNDLGRICTPGSVRAGELFRVERYPALLQMTSTVEGALRPGLSYYELFRALFPCGSITGAPKVRTMQAIGKLESGPRGIACGAIGFFAPNGDSVFSVAIRTATLRGGEVRMRVGSGITYDSIAAAEHEECLLKARFLTHQPQPFQLIETLRWNDGYFLLQEHLDRLRESAGYFDFSIHEDSIRQELLNHAARFQAGSCHRVRLLLARTGDPTLTSEPLTPQCGTARLVVASERTDAADRFLRHKTTRRAVYDRAIAAARSAGFDDALFLNQASEVTECAIHNLLILRGGEMRTPSLDSGVLPGVYRRWLLQRHPEIREASISLADLETADRVYIFNSVRGLRRVAEIVPYLRHVDTAR